MLDPHKPVHKLIIYFLAYLKILFGFKYTKDLIPQFKFIGDYTYGLPMIHSLLPDSKISIGRYCSFANDVNIFLDGEHHLSSVSTYPFLYLNNKSNTKVSALKDIRSKGPVTIGNDVWIGFGVTVLSGVKIGTGSVIAAGSVVTKDVKPFEIVGGVPAKHIRFRFEKNEITKIMNSKWWLEEPEAAQTVVAKLSSCLCKQK